MILSEFKIHLFLFTFLFKTTLGESEWIDPFNVNFVAERRPSELDLNANDLEKMIDKSCTAPSNDALLYFKRTINLLLSSVTLDEISGDYKGKLVINLPIDDFKVLKEFTNGEIIEPLMLQKINEILTNTLEMTLVDKIELAFISWTEIWYNMLKSQTTWFVLISLSVLFVIYRLFNAKFSTKQVICYVASLGYVFDYFITWKRMLQEHEINQYADSLQYTNVPDDCFPKSMTGWQVFTSYFKSTTDCRQYYKAIMYDFMWEVGPLDVFAHQTRVLIQIFNNIGIAVSQMVHGLMSNFPFPLNLLLLIPLMLFVLFIICIVFTYCTNTHISINLMHLIQFKLKKTPTIPTVSREEIQEILQSATEKVTEQIEMEKLKKKEDKNKVILEKKEKNTKSIKIKAIEEGESEEVNEEDNIECKVKANCDEKSEIS